MDENNGHIDSKTKFATYWTLLFPELNLYRFVHKDEEIEDLDVVDRE